MKPKSRALRRVRRALFLAAALLVATAAVAPVIARAAPSDPDADRPIVWSGNASASAIHVNADRSQGLLPLKDPFFMSAPEAESDWDNGSNNARASLVFPGPAGVVAVGTICEQVLPQIFGPSAIPIPPSPTFDAVCRPAPTFPLTVQADNSKADARTDGSTVIGSGFPLTLTTSSAIAHADRDYVGSDTVVGSVNVVGTSVMAPSSLAFRRQAAGILGGPAAAAAVRAEATDDSTLHIDSAVAHTKQTWDTDGALLVKATTTLKGVSLAGGAIHIGVIDSTSTSRTDGRGIATHDEHINFGGVTVSGQPAAIDETGVHVGGSSSSAKPLTDSLNTLLKNVGASVTLASVSGDVKDQNPKQVSSEANGLIFHIQQHLDIPNAQDDYFANFTLGVAGTQAVAASDRGSSPPAEEGGIGGVTGPSADQSSSASPASETPGSFDPGTPGTPGTPGSFATTSRRARSSVLGKRSGLIGQLEAQLAGFSIAHRFELVYLAFALAFVGVCLSSRLLVPRPRRIS
jgi:hypothetical protein